MRTEVSPPAGNAAGDGGAYRWLASLCLVELGTMLVMMNYSAVLPILQVEWGLSGSQAGTIFSAYWGGYLLAVLLLTTLTDYVNPRLVYACSALWAGLANLLFTFGADGFLWGAILRALTGLGLAGTYAPGMKLVAQRFPAERRGFAIGCYTSCFGLGGGLSLFLSGWLTAAGGWQRAFLVTSFGPLAAGLVALWILRGIPKPAPTSRLSVSRLLRNRPALLTTAAYMAHGWELFGFRAWLVVFLAARLTETGTPLVLATDFASRSAGVITLAGALASVTGGWLSDRLGRTTIMLLASSTSAILSILLGWLFFLPMGLLLGIVSLLGIMIMLDSSTISTTITEAADPDHLGATIALYSFLGFLAAMAAPAVFGFILDLTNPVPSGGQSGLADQWGWAFTALGIGGGLVPVVALTLRHRSRRIPLS